MSSEDTFVNTLQALRNLSDEDRDRREQAQCDIGEWQKTPGFCNLLEQIIRRATDPKDIKITLVVFRKTVSRFWSGYDGYEIPLPEKEQIRASLLSLLMTCGNNKQVVKEIVYMLTVVVYHEFPHNWPSALTDVSTLIQSPEPEVRIKGLRLLSSFLRAFFDLGVVVTRNINLPKTEELNTCISQQAPAMFSILATLWLESNSALLEQLSHVLQGQAWDANILETAGTQCTLSMRILWIIFSYFLKNLQEANESATGQFFLGIGKMLEASISCIQVFQERKLDIPGTKNYLASVVLRIIQLLNCTQSNQPMAFLPYLQFYLDFFLQEFFKARLLTRDESQFEFQEKYYVAVITFLTDVISASDYHILEEDEVTPATQIIRKFFNGDTIQDITRIIVSKYFILTPEWASDWEEEPEQFLDNEMSDLSASCLNPATELFFWWTVRINLEHGPKIGKFLLEAITSGSHPEHSIPPVLYQESLYHAYAVCGDQLKGQDFFLKQFCLEHVQSRFGNMHVMVKRRVADIIQHWSSEVLEEFGSWGYETLLRCFSEDDLVTRVAAAQGLKVVLEELDMNNLQYYKYIGQSVEAIVALANDMDGGPITVSVLDIVKDVVGSLKESIRPVAMDLLEVLKRLWGLSKKKKMVLCTITQILAKFVAGLIGSPIEFETPLISFLTEILEKRQSSPALLEDGLVLWWRIVDQAAFISPKMGSLFSYLPHVLDENDGDSRVTQSCLNILTCYVLNGKYGFFTKNFSEIMMLLSMCLGNSHKNSIVVSVVEFLKICVRMFPKEVAKFKDALTSLMFLFVGDDCPLPKHVEDRSSASCIGSLFFELALDHTEFFFAFMNELPKIQLEDAVNPFASDIGNPTYHFLSVFLDIVEPEEYVVLQSERITLQGLCKFLEINDSQMFSLHPKIIQQCYWTLEDIRKKNHDSTGAFRNKNALIEGSPGHRALEQVKGKRKKEK
eukprot:TRINITY_DN5306_c0_g1_i2.p1 TRINITY_DN5306_c0_g1~~TRINITY_DN5306_c0_g1_i2.p1  ORF type:complete len:961 (+),score=180.79 TRINITY_DN5306_c0_g1_i2:1-2883(+)